MSPPSHPSHGAPSHLARRCRAGVVLMLAAVAGLISRPAAAQSAKAPEQGRELPPIPIPPDSARGDHAAFESLPEAVKGVLDVRRQLQADALPPGLACVPLSTTSDGSRRQRVQGRIDGLGIVVFARVDARGVLQRVEFVRRLPTGGQRGYTWDAAGDATTGMEWPAGSTEAASHPVPRGGPIPRAVRGLGRLVLTWRCRDA